MAKSTWQARAVQGGVLAVAFGALMTMTGCGAMNMTESGAAGGGQAVEGPALHGIVHGGNNPVAGATIQLYSVGASGYGQGALPLLTKVVKTDSNGSFAFSTSDWACVSGTYIYMTSTGGNPGLSSTTNGGNAATPNNNAASFMAALGNCSNITSNTNILLNEITTVAAVFALQQFISITPNVSLYAQPGTASGVTPAVAPAFEIGSSSGNVQGLKNAFEVAAVLANTSTGVTPGALPAYTGPGASSTRTLTVETWHINTIADILASCINTDTTAGNTDYSATCSQLAQSVTPSTTNLPVDTLQIAYTMTQNPSYNVQNTFGYVTSVGAPFVPSDQVVSDWTLAYRVAYSYNTAGGSYPLLLNTDTGIAFDSYGNAWIANTGHASSNVPTFVAQLDPAGNYLGQYNSYNLAGTTTSFAVTPSSNFIQPIAIDPSNNVWTEDVGNSALVRIAAAGGANVLSTGPNYGISAGAGSLGYASGAQGEMAIDGSGNVYMTEVGSASPTFNATFGTANDTGLAVLIPSISGGQMTAGTGSMVAKLNSNSDKGIAITPSASGTSYGGLVYVATPADTCGSTDTAGLNTYFASGQTVGTTTTAVGQATPIGLVVNSAGYATCTTATKATPTTASQMYGGTTYSTVPAMDTPYGLAADGSGDVWVANLPGSVIASGFPQYWITELVPTYVQSGSGALSASYVANLYTAPFLSGTSNGATSTVTPGVANGAAIDGNGSVFYASSSAYGVAFGVSQSGTFLNPTSPISATLTSGSSTQTWLCGGFCGGEVFADYGSRRGQGAGFASIAIDLAGNLWGGQSNSGADNVTIIVGVAAPPVLPISLALKNGTLGTKP